MRYFPTYDTLSFPLDENRLVLVKEFIHHEVSSKCISEESSTERRSYNRQVDRSPQLSQYWSDKIRKAFSSQSTPLVVVQLTNIFPCAAAERLPRLVRRKVAMLRAFNICFEKFLKNCSYF